VDEGATGSVFFWAIADLLPADTSDPRRLARRATVRAL
jgi:hypothetical protein